MRKAVNAALFVALFAPFPATAQTAGDMVDAAVGRYLSPNREYYIEIYRCRPREAELFCGQREGMPADNLLCARIPMAGLSDKRADPETGVGPGATAEDRAFVFGPTNGYVGCFAPIAPSTQGGGSLCADAAFEGVAFSWETYERLGVGDGSMFGRLEGSRFVFHGCPGERDWSDGGRYFGAYGGCDVGSYGPDACESAVLTRTDP